MCRLSNDYSWKLFYVIRVTFYQRRESTRRVYLMELKIYEREAKFGRKIFPAWIMKLKKPSKDAQSWKVLFHMVSWGAER